LSNTIERRFGKVWLLPATILGLAAFAPAMFASPCMDESLSTYDTAGFTCTIDGYTLSDVTFSESGGADLPDSEITVVPSITSSGFQFEFEGDFTDSSMTNTAYYIVQYELDPVFPKVNGIDIGLGPADPPTLYGQFCGDGTISSTFDPTHPLDFTCTAGGEPAVLEVVGNNESDSENFATQVTNVDSQLILQLDCDSTAASFSGGVLLATPEPSLLALLIPGLIGLLLMGRKRLASAR
jgi:hypothetical protein